MKATTIHHLMNDYLDSHTLARVFLVPATPIATPSNTKLHIKGTDASIKAWRVLDYVRKYPTALSGLNRTELAIYKAIVNNCGEEM